MINFKNGVVLDNNLNKLLNLEDKGVFNFGWGNIDKKFLEDIDTDEYLRNVAIKYKSEFSVYSDKFGLKELREEVIEFLKRIYHIDSSFDFENIIITNGATNAIALVTHYLSASLGKTVVCQEPTYDTALNIFRSHGLKVASLQPTVELESIEKILRENEQQPAFAYLMTILQNPTGMTLDENKRSELFQKFKERDIYIVEDDAYGLFTFNRHPYKLFEEYSKFVYIGSFSKYIFPALRIGYIFSPDKLFISRVASLQKYLNSSPNVLSQYFLYEYLHGNHDGLMRSIARRNQILDNKRVIVEDALSDIRCISYDASIGGFYYWLKLQAGVNAEHVFRDLIKQKVFLIPGDVYFWKENLYNALRLSIGQIDIEKIREGIHKIKEVVEKYD